MGLVSDKYSDHVARRFNELLTEKERIWCWANTLDFLSQVPEDSPYYAPRTKTAIEKSISEKLKQAIKDEP